MNRTLPRPITEDEIATYERDGVLLLRGLFDRDWVTRMRDATLRLMEKPRHPRRELTPQDNPGRFFMCVYMWRIDPDFRAFVFESPAAEIAAALMRSSRVNFFYDHLFVKEPGTLEPTHWHNDLPFWPVLGEQITSIWIALTPATEENSGLEYVRGSHKWRKWYKAITPSRDAHYAATELEECPNFSTLRDRYDVVSWSMEPGDILVHHPLTAHGAPGNASLSERRIGLATRWTGDDAMYDPRPATLPLAGDPGLAKGDPLGGPEFPEVPWRPREGTQA